MHVCACVVFPLDKHIVHNVQLLLIKKEPEPTLNDVWKIAYVFEMTRLGFRTLVFWGKDVAGKNRQVQDVQGSEILFYLLAEQIVQKIPLFSGQKLMARQW